MSRESRDRVWQYSTFGGSQLVALLALAERADANGICWPGMAELQDRCRRKERATRLLLSELENAGAIFSVTQAAAGQRTKFFITVGLPFEVIESTLVSEYQMEADEAGETARGILELQSNQTPLGGQNTTSLKRGRGGNSLPLGGQILALRGANSCTPYKDEPSGTVIEPSEEESAGAPEAQKHSSSPRPVSHVQSFTPKTSLMPPAAKAEPNWRQSPVPENPPVPSGGIVASLCRVCFLNPDNPGSSNIRALPSAKIAAQSKMPGASESEVGAEIERLFASELWDFDSPPRLSQIDTDWFIQKRKADSAGRSQFGRPAPVSNARSMEETLKSLRDFDKLFESHVASRQVLS